MSCSQFYRQRLPVRTESGSVPPLLPKRLSALFNFLVTTQTQQGFSCLTKSTGEKRGGLGESLHKKGKEPMRIMIRIIAGFLFAARCWVTLSAASPSFASSTSGDCTTQGPRDTGGTVVLLNGTMNRNLWTLERASSLASPRRAQRLALRQGSAAFAPHGMQVHGMGGNGFVSSANALLAATTPRFPTSSAASRTSIPSPGGKRAPKYKIVDVAADFISYYVKCNRLAEAQRKAQWDRLLEKKHPDFFQEVIYRKKRGTDREEFKESCMQTFWTDVAPKMSTVRKLHLTAADTIREVVNSFQKKFPDFRPSTDFYLTISFSFHGKVVDVKGKDVFAIGLENFEPGQPHFRITIAHELFHLYHFQFFNASGGLYRTLWAEGLASYASAVVVPGYRFSQYLGFPGEKMNRCQELMPTLAKELLREMGESDKRIKRIYFGAEPNDTQIPPEAGYYVGFVIIESLAKRTSLADLARMKSNDVFATLRRELTRLSENR